MRMALRSKSLRLLVGLMLGLTPLVPSGLSAENQGQDEGGQAPSHEQVVALADRAIALQHGDDEAGQYFERIERRISRSSATNGKILEEKVYRTVPTGTGTLNLLLRDRGQGVDQAEYRRELQAWKATLEQALRPNDAGYKAAYARFVKKNKDRADIVDATRQAYLATWLGRETWAGRTYIKLRLDPNPAYHATKLTTEFLAHARATIWIDEKSGHLARGEADIIRDMSIGGGILGKIYHGGHFEIVQEEVEDGVWLPVRYQYDFSGRKFLFAFEQHTSTEISRYHRIGAPREAIAVAQRDLASGQVPAGDP
ncbi:MAG: hypothetical protein ACRD50_03720 [Candidatus Acidiferrales bacterium]